MSVVASAPARSFSGKGISREEFSGIFDSSHSKIRGICISIVGEDFADDMVQETFLRAWNHIDTFRGDAKIYTWLYRIAVNTCLIALRHGRVMSCEQFGEI